MMNDPTARLGYFDLEELESEVRRAIDDHEPDRLELVGQGEMSLALRWGDDRVVKRVPPFANRRLADEYCGLVAGYVAALEERGVRCVATESFVLDRADRSAVVYLSQPHLNADGIGNNVLAGAEPSADHPLLIAVVDSIVAGIGAPLGVDGQVANWYWDGTEAWHLDFSTPFLLDGEGLPQFAPEGFMQEYPVVLRHLVKRELFKIAPKYQDLEFILNDLGGNLFRQKLDPWVPPYIDVVAARTSVAVNADEARAALEADAKLWPMLLRLKRWQRAWIQRTGRRYDTLLPTTSNY